MLGMEQHSPRIELRNVSKTYGGILKAVDDLTLTVEPGSVQGFLGPNGAGKTTTIKLITGVLQADAGNISVGGYDIETDNIEAKKTFGFVPDKADAFRNPTGLEYLNFMADMYEVRWDRGCPELDLTPAGTTSSQTRVVGAHDPPLGRPSGQDRSPGANGTTG